MDIYDEGIERLADAIVVQAALDYLESKKSIYQHGDTFNMRNLVTDTTIFFNSEWFSLLCKLDGTGLRRMLDKEFDEWRKEYNAKKRRKG